MSTNPLVSVIVPTKNSASTLEACLRSIRRQTYKKLEILVVDNSSDDMTTAIASLSADKVYIKGPERSAQRNYGVNKSNGEIIFIIDSDMELTTNVVMECINEFNRNADVVGIVIPEESYGIGFWAQCKKLERSFYHSVDWMEAARAFRKNTYFHVGGYDEDMVSGEDWDLSQRVASLGDIGRIDSYIMHNEGKLKLTHSLRKKYYYAKKFSAYSSKNKDNINKNLQTNVFARYGLFLKDPLKLLKNPFLGVGMLFMKSCEFGIGLFGSKVSKLLK